MNPYLKVDTANARVVASGQARRWDWQRLLGREYHVNGNRCFEPGDNAASAHYHPEVQILPTLNSLLGVVEPLPLKRVPELSS